MKPSPRLSVCMIVKNEAANLADALADIKPFADELVVVDTGSVDGTREIAERFTPTVYDFAWIDDFAAARNFAISKATGDYHLWLDADDRISPENQAHINALKAYFDGKKAFYFVLENHINLSHRNRCKQLRCTPLLPGVEFQGRIHEQIYPSAVRRGLELVTTDIVIEHMGYMDEETRIAKAKRNLGILERQVEEGTENGAVYFFLALTHAPLGDREKGMRCMTAALERFEKEPLNHHLIPDGYLFLAQVSQEMGDTDKALRYLARTQSLADGSPFHNFQMGILYQRMGKHAEAVRRFEQMAGKTYDPGFFPAPPPPGPHEVFLHAAYSALCMNDRDRAMDLIRKSGQAGFEAHDGWEWLGVKAFAFQNAQLAIFAFETARRLGGLDPGNWRILGKLYKARGFTLKAEECMRNSAQSPAGDGALK